MIFLFSGLVALTTYLYFYKITKDSLNPFGVSIFIYLSMYGLSTMNLSIYQEPMCILTHFICWIPISIIFVIGICFCNRYHHSFLEEKIPFVTPNYKKIMWLICGVCLIAVVYLIVTRGFNLKIDLNEVAALNYRKGEITRQVFKGSGFIGKLAIVFPYTVVFVAYDFIFDNNKKFITRVIEIVYATICTWYMLFALASRGTLLLPVLGILYLLNKKYHFRARTVALTLFAVLLGFTVYLNIRIIAESAVFSGTIVENRTFNSVYNYFALAFNNFDMLVRHGSPFTVIEYSFISLSKLLGVYNSEHILEFKTLFFNEELFIYGFYHDLGLVGVIVWTTIIYLVIGTIYVYSKNKNPELILLIAMFGKAIFVLSFGNYFFGSISVEMQYYICIIIIVFGYHFKQLKVIRFRILQYTHPRLRKIKLRLNARIRKSV